MQAKNQCIATPVYVPRGMTKEVIVNFDDLYITDNYDPSKH